MQTIKDSIKTIITSLITLSLISVVYAWTEPTTTPPSSNVNPPITTSSSTQTKTGWFTADNIETYGDTYLSTIAGNVGIGTTTTVAGRKLDVRATSGIAVYGENDDSVYAAIYGKNTGTGPAARFQGNIGINTGATIPLAIGDSDTGLSQAGDGILTFLTNNSEGMRIDASGNVGIGTTPSSGAKLSVEGPIKISKNNSLTCSSTLAGTIKLNSSSNALEYCNGSYWKTITSQISLVNGEHTDLECETLNGTVQDDGSGNYMCKFTAASCPSGWTQYNNWSTTQTGTSIYKNETVSGDCSRVDETTEECGLSSATCSTSYHVWGNVAIESTPCSGIEKQRKNSYYRCPTSRADCSGATSVTAYAITTDIGCY